MSPGGHQSACMCHQRLNQTKRNTEFCEVARMSPLMMLEVPADQAGQDGTSRPGRAGIGSAGLRYQ